LRSQGDFTWELKRQFESAKRTKRPFSLLRIQLERVDSDTSLDHGEWCRRLQIIVAREIRTRVRSYDDVGESGLDGVEVLLTDTTFWLANLIAMRISKRLQKVVTQSSYHGKVRFGFVYSVATYPYSASNLHGLRFTLDRETRGQVEAGARIEFTQGPQGAPPSELNFEFWSRDSLLAFEPILFRDLAACSEGAGCLVATGRWAEACTAAETFLGRLQQSGYIVHLSQTGIEGGEDYLACLTPHRSILLKTRSVSEGYEVFLSTASMRARNCIEEFLGQLRGEEE